MINETLLRICEVKYEHVFQIFMSLFTILCPVKSPVQNAQKLYLEPVSVGRLEKAMAKEKLKPRFTPDKSNVLVTDDHDAYNRVLYGTGAKHEVVNAKQHKRGKYNLATVNSVHSALDSYMDSHRGRVFNTKYLDLSKTWHNSNPNVSWAETLEHAEKIGVGTRQYELITGV